MSCCNQNSADLAELAINEKLSVDEARILSASITDKSGLTHTDFLIPEMHCVGCINKIENELISDNGVAYVRANLSTKKVSVKWDSNIIRGGSIEQKIKSLGFKAELFDFGGSDTAQTEIGKRLLISLGVAGFAAANIMLLSISVWSGAAGASAQLFNLISGLIALPAVIYAGRPFFASAFSALRLKRLNMDVPISLAVIMALGMSLFEALLGGRETYFDAAVMLLFFLLIGRYLDHMMREKARGAVSRLSKMASGGATLIKSGGSKEFIALGELQTGMRILVAVGERIPADSIVVKGISMVDRSMVTGESCEVEARLDLELEAGTINLSGPLELEILRPVSQSFVAEVIKLMEAAEQGKARFVRIADRLAQIYAPVVHIVAFTGFAGWMIYTGGDWRHSLYVSIAILIITCPCALGLAVPIVHVVGAGRLFNSGIMIKDGGAFERLCEIDTIMFDKTGTLTKGQPVIIGVHGGSGEEHALASVLASYSNHPSSRALVQFGLIHNYDNSSFEFEDIKEHAGLGIEAVISGQKVRLGKESFVCEIAAVTEKTVRRSKQEVFFAQENGAFISFELKDELREDAVEIIRDLKDRGFAVGILSGDVVASVEEVAAELVVEDWHAQMMPLDKTLWIQNLTAKGHRVLVVGDGINDAPALAAGHVSMAPSSGSDVGKMAADLVFTSERLGAIIETIDVAHKTDRLVRQNFGLAIAYNCIAVPLALLGFVTPLIAAVAMSTSSIVVIANSMRLHFSIKKKMKNTGISKEYHTKKRLAA